MSQRERTFVMVKAGGVQRGLISETLLRFERKGLKLVALKFVQPTEDILKKHYADLSSLPFFPSLVKGGASGPAACMVFEGINAVLYGRLILGATDPAKAEMGTLRADFAIDIARNIAHASDSVAAAEKEVSLWFSPADIVDWTQCTESWIHE